MGIWSGKLTTHNFNKSTAELAGGGLLLLIGFSASNGFFIKAGNIGIAKGFCTLFISSSLAIWRKIPRRKMPTKDDKSGNIAKAIQAERNNSLKKMISTLSCIALATFTIIYCMNLNIPDIPLRVVGMQTGIMDHYPNNVPPDFSLTDISSEDSKTTINFKSHTTGNVFSLIAEQSSWNPNALLTSFIERNYSSNYTTIHKQGLTIYIDGSNASWINDKVVYKIVSSSDSLTEEQICSIATSI